MARVGFANYVKGTSIMRAPERARVLRRKKQKKGKRKRKNERKKKRNGGARRAVVTRMEQHRRFRYIRRVSLFRTRRSPRRLCISRFLFFFSPLPDKTHLRYCLSALRNGGEGDTSKEEKDWDGKYGGGYESR